MRPIAESDLIESLLKILPDFLIKNSDLIGFTNYGKSSQLQLSIILLAYVLNFVFAILTKRHLVNLFKQLKILENKHGERYTLNRINSHQHIKWLIKLRILWPVFDFVARFTFVALGLVIFAYCIHWKLSGFNWIYLIVLSSYFVFISFSLIFKPQERNRGEYKNLNDDTLDVEEIQTLSRTEDTVARLRVLALRRFF